ncbi:hypothetical protein KCU62_g9566, partial [Aureobasidium sp. EXF-3399]
MIAAVSLRAYIRIRSGRIGWDDWFTFVAAGLTVVYTADALYQTRLGLGLPLALRPPDDLHVFTLLNYAGRPIYIAALAAFKVAACYGALRVIKGTNRRALRIVIKRFRDFIVVIMSSIPTLNGMNSALGKTDITPSNTDYGTDSYRELPNAGIELDELSKLSRIMRTREYVIEKSKKQGDPENTPTAPTSW